MNPTSNTNATVTLPGTQDDWVPKDWVIKAFGTLAYLSYLNRDTNLDATIRFSEPPFEIIITRSVAETALVPAPDSESANSLQEMSATEAQELEEVESCCREYCNPAETSAERTHEATEHSDDNATRTHNSSPGATTAEGRLDEQIQALSGEVARRRSRRLISGRDQSSQDIFSRRGPGFGSTTTSPSPPSPPSNQTSTPPSSPTPHPPSQLQRSNAFYGERHLAAMVRANAVGYTATPTQTTPVARRPLRRSGAFYGQPDWAEMANVYGLSDITRRTTGSPATTATQSIASSQPGPSANGSSTLDRQTEAPEGANDVPVVAIRMAPPLTRPRRAVPSALDLRRRHEDPPVIPDTSDDTADEIVDSRPRKKRRMESSGGSSNRRADDKGKRGKR